MAYLDKPEIDALLGAPDRRTERGARDHAILLFLYNTGARVGEATHVTVGDLTWGSSSRVRLMGKGNKARYCPLWAQTVAVLKPLVRGRAAHERVFLNRLGQPLIIRRPHYFICLSVSPFVSPQGETIHRRFTETRCAAALAAEFQSFKNDSAQPPIKFKGPSAAGPSAG